MIRSRPDSGHGPGGETRAISPRAVAVRFGRRWLNIFNRRNLCLVAGAIALVYLAATVFSYAHILSTDQTVNGEGLISGDYAAFYAAGRLVLQGETSHLYDAGSVRALQQAAILGRVPDFYVAYRNPPFFAVVFAPLATLELIPSFAVWTLASVALLVVAVGLTLRTFPQLRTRWKLVALVVAGFCPMYSGLVDGQNAALSLLLYVLVFQALRAGRDARAGAWAAAGLFKPQLFFVLPLVFVASRRWRALLVYCGVVSALAAASLALVGVDGAVAWARIIVGFEPGNAAKLAGRMYSLKAFFDVLLPGQTNLSLGLSLIGSLVVLAMVVRIWQAGSTVRHDLALRWVFTMLAALLVDPHLLDYDLTVLVLPGLLIVGALSDAPWWIAAMFVVTLIDVPLTLGSLNLQVGVVLLAALAFRVWWRLERGQQLRLLAQTRVQLAEIPQHGGTCAA